MFDPCSVPLPKPTIMTTASAVKPAVSAAEASRGRPMAPSPANVRSETPPLPPPYGPPEGDDDPGAASSASETGAVPVPEEITTEH